MTWQTGGSFTQFGVISCGYPVEFLTLIALWSTNVRGGKSAPGWPLIWQRKWRQMVWILSQLSIITIHYILRTDFLVPLWSNVLRGVLCLHSFEIQWGIFKIRWPYLLYHLTHIVFFIPPDFAVAVGLLLESHHDWLKKPWPKPWQ